jgi:hypothetical protein
MKQISLIAVLALLTAFNLLGCASITPANDSTPLSFALLKPRKKTMCGLRLPC